MPWADLLRRVRAVDVLRCDLGITACRGPAFDASRYIYVHPDSASIVELSL